MTDVPLIIIFLGRSGCGKGTQGEKIRQKYGLEYFGSGENLRERAKNDGFTGRKIKEFIDVGVFVPVPVVVQIWINKLEDYKNNFSEFKGLVFDGAPRKLMEAQLLDLALEWYEWNRSIRVILIDISEEEAFKRLTNRKICANCKKKFSYLDDHKIYEKCDVCGGDLIKRADDTPESIRERLDEFNRETLPVLDYYEKQGLVIRIDGNRPIEEVHQSILTALK